ncbi:MAG: metal-dependent hydrolase [Deltaproteobacteria bacterium]|nr:metal-dependent hydrolase [Deltaproteobacteria bacterium]
MTKAIQTTWLGHSTFLFETPEGKTVLIDPWIKENPVCPAHLKKMKKPVDLLLITHGHFDHIGDAVAVAQEFKPQVVAIYETCLWLAGKKVEQMNPMNKGGSQTVCDVKITMTHAMHSCGIQDGDQVIYGGEACGYILKFSNGRIFYHAGDTAVFGDMAILQKLYKPDTAFLPIGDRFVMSPQEAAHAATLLKTDQLVPMHYGTFPLLTGTPAALRELLGKDKNKVIEFKPGETKTL